MISTGLAVACLVLVAWASNRLRKVGSREPGLPPGPPTLPILGNIHMFATTHTHLRFTEWAKIYGDIYSIKMGPTTGIVISSPKLAREYIDLRGSTTSDRPPVYVDELISNNLEFALTPYGPIWRNMRRAAHDMLSPRACLNHIPIQQAESAQLLFDFMTSPKNFYTHINRYSGSVITAVVYGIHSPKYEGGLVEKFDRYTARLERSLKPGNSPPVDIFPFLRYLPEFLGPTPWRTWAQQVRDEQREIFFGLLDIVLDRIRNDQRNGCFLEGVIDRQEHYGLDRELVGYLGGSLLQAGNDTTAIFLQTFLVTMIAHPAEQQRAQQEIDDVIGFDRFPEFEDFERLPYLKAVISEIYRLRPTVPLAIPHATTVDQRMGDYLVPKGSMLFINAWGIYRHEEHYDNPEVFDPERFMRNPHGVRSGSDPTGCRTDYAFGAGRRICPGIHLANNSIALNAMNLLWAFSFLPAKDPLTGENIPVDMADVKPESVLLVPKPFQCEIQPRSEVKAEMIRKQYEEAQLVFQRFELHDPVALRKQRK